MSESDDKKIEKYICEYRTFGKIRVSAIYAEAEGITKWKIVEYLQNDQNNTRAYTGVQKWFWSVNNVQKNREV